MKKLNYDKINYDEVKKEIKQISKEAEAAGIDSQLQDYTLAEATLKKRWTEATLKKRWNVFFCNGLSHPINRVRLVYSAYDRLLGIKPIHDDPEKTHGSFFNFDVPEEAYIDLEKNNKEMFQLWNKLIKS